MGDENADGTTDRATQERARAHAQRWATPGDDPFEQWYWTMNRYFNRKIDPEILEIYRKMLGKIPIEQLQAVFEQYIMQPDISPREPPKCNVLYAMWKARTDKREEKITTRRTKQAELPGTGPRDELRKSMFPLIAKALLAGGTEHWRPELEAPEWMHIIADYCHQQFRNDHPDRGLDEITDEERLAYFEMGLKLFDDERAAYDESNIDVGGSDEKASD